MSEKIRGKMVIEIECDKLEEVDFEALGDEEWNFTILENTLKANRITFAFIVSQALENIVEMFTKMGSSKDETEELLIEIIKNIIAMEEY